MLRGGIAGLGCLLALTGASPYPNVMVNESCCPEETSIAINPTNPDNIVGVAQSQAGELFYVSVDGGTSWTEGNLLDPRALGDPSIAFDGDGNAYYGYIGMFTHTGIFVNQSVDGGVTWPPNGTAVVEREGRTPFEDKSYVACDATDGAFRGNVYVAWTQFDSLGSAAPEDSSRIHFARSTDGGLSFTAPVRISDQAGDCRDSDDTVEGAVPAVGPDGTVYTAWSGPRGIEFDRSTDGGLSFGTDLVISDQPGGWAFAVPGMYRCNGFPITKADLSQGPYRGRVYVCWSDQRNGDTDVFLLHSDDGGATWSSKVRVNDDPVGNGRHQFFPWMDVDPVTGQVCIVFYDRRESVDSLATDVYLAVSEDGGDSFVNEKISDSPFTPTPDVFFGDYIGVAAYGGRIRPLWTRLDGTTLSLWTALVDPDPGTPVQFSDLQGAPLRDGVELSWRADAGVFAFFRVEQLVDRDFVEVDEVPLNHGVSYSWRRRGLPRGEYTYRIAGIRRAGGPRYLGPISLAVGSAPAHMTLEAASFVKGDAPVELTLGAPESGDLRIRILDLQGRQVSSLDAGWFPPGWHAVSWAPRSGQGQRLASGVYFLRATLARDVATTRVLVLR